MKIEITPYHMITFIYMGFAHLPDGKISKEESKEIEQKVARWMKVSYKNINTYNDVVSQTSEWYNSMPDEEKISTLLNMAATLHKQEFMTEEHCKDLMSDIRDIAVADGRFGEKEKHLHDMVAKEFGINVLTAQEPKKRKSIGFKKS